jgi:hypothetical protein
MPAGLFSCDRVPKFGHWPKAWIESGVRSNLILSRLCRERIEQVSAKGRMRTIQIAADPSNFDDLPVVARTSGQPQIHERRPALVQTSRRS